MAGTPRRSKRSAAHEGALLLSATVGACRGGITGEPVPTKFECPTSTVVVWFRPEGHPPIASINAPEARSACRDHLRRPRGLLPGCERCVQPRAGSLVRVLSIPAGRSCSRWRRGTIGSHPYLHPGDRGGHLEEQLTKEPVTMTIAAGDSIVAGVTLAPRRPHAYVPTPGVHPERESDVSRVSRTSSWRGSRLVKEDGS